MNRKTLALVVFAVGVLAFVGGRYSRRPAGAAVTQEKKVAYYVDPMHPAYRSDKPGTAPDCGMDLEPVYEGDEDSARVNPAPGSVAINTTRQELYGIRVESVKKHAGHYAVRTTGRVQAEDSKIYRLMAATEGWVQSLKNNPVGSLVKKDELLATYYSREFRNAEQAYLQSLVTLDRLKPGRDLEDASKVNEANLRVNEEQLRALGMSEPQIKELAKSRQITRDITINSPVDGIVLTREISPLQKFDRGAEFYRIADLNEVWIYADVFGDEGELYRPGAHVRVTLREVGKTLTATVDNSPPVFDPVSRAFKLRLTAENLGVLLRPEMYVDLEFDVNAPHGIAIPQEAVLDTGMGKTVYVETSEGIFQPRSVQVGTSSGNRVVIVSGLSEGDRYVASGNFLVDSESRLRGTPVSAANNLGDRKSAQVADKDPVCGMKLNDAQAHSGQHQESYRGEIFRFCSDDCQNKFHKNPTRYTGNSDAADVSGHDERHEARR